MRILIVGAGAVGGYLGAQLAGAGRQVGFLARDGRAARLRAQGLTVVGPTGSTTTHVPVLTAAEVTEPYDLVVLAVKAAALQSAMDDLAGAVAPHTRILPLLNGIRHIETLRERFGQQAVLGGVATLATQLDAEGRVHVLGPAAQISYGELDGRHSAVLDRIDEELSGAGIGHTVSSTIEQDLWEKWFFMAAGGAVSVLLGGPVGAIVGENGGPAAITEVIDEAAAILEAAGHPVRPAASAFVSGMLTASGSPFTTSLYRDFVDGRDTEAETILGDLVMIAAQHRVRSPLLRAAAVRLRVRAAALASRA